jgi:hypothetical protein
MGDHEVPQAQMPWTIRYQVALLAVMTAGGLTVSYSGLYKVAIDAQMPHPWILPLLLDGLGLVMAAAIWDARREGDTSWPAMVVLVAVTCASSTIQAATAPDGWPARAAHAWPPAIVLVAFECLLWTYGRARRRAAVATANVAASEAAMPSDQGERVAVSARPPAVSDRPRVPRVPTVDLRPPEVDDVPVSAPRPVRQAPAARSGVSVEDIRRAVAEVVRSDDQPTMATVAARLGVSDRTLRRHASAGDIAAMAAELAEAAA